MAGFWFQMRFLPSNCSKTIFPPSLKIKGIRKNWGVQGRKDISFKIKGLKTTSRIYSFSSFFGGFVPFGGSLLPPHHLPSACECISQRSFQRNCARIIVVHIPSSALLPGLHFLLSHLRSFSPYMYSLLLFPSATSYPSAVSLSSLPALIPFSPDECRKSPQGSKGLPASHYKGQEKEELNNDKEDEEDNEGRIDSSYRNLC
jgi:hypothetical protein